MTDRTIELRLADPVAELVLNKPERRNALSQDMWGAIPGLIAEVAAAASVKVVILHGGEAGAFAAGADISEFEEIYSTPERARTSGMVIARALEAIETCPKPVLAAIEGACVGGGLSLALAADLRVGAEESKFGITPGKLGLVYPAADTRRLVSAVGVPTAKDILFTGRLFDASEARAMGLIDRLTGKGEALEAARRLASEIGSISQWSVRATKAMIAGLASGWADTAEAAEALYLEGFANIDFQEGYRAFLEKRPARFTFK